MKGRKRRLTRPQGDRDIVRAQAGFLGGMNLDVPSSKIDDNEVADTLNVKCYRTHIECRSGTLKIGNLSGLTDVSAVFFHRSMNRYIYLRGSDVYLATYGATLDEFQSTKATMGNSADTEIDISRTTIKEFGNNALIFQETGIFIIEIAEDNSTPSFVRRFNEPNPANPLGIATTDPAGSYVYRFTYTMVRVEGNVNIDDFTTILTSETGSYQPINSSFNPYTEITMNVPLTLASQVSISSFVPPADTDYTHIILYRTENIGLDPETGLGSSNNPNLYYATAIYTFEQAANYSTQVGIGNMTIGTTFIISYSSNDIGAPDESLIDYPLLKTFGFEPLPNGSIGEVGQAFVLVAPQDSHVLYYSQSSNPRYAGYYSKAFQFVSVDDSINIISRSPDVAVILCNRSTYRLTLFTSRTVDSNLGTSISVIEAPALIDDSLGVKDWGSLAIIDESRFIALCSDNTVRIWDSQKWGVDLSRFKVSTEIQKIVTGSVGLYNPQGFYLLWYRTDASESFTNKCLRLGLVEDVGKGWSFYGGSGWPFPKPYVGCCNIMEYSFNKQLMSVVDFSYPEDDGLPVYIVETYEGPADSNLRKEIVDRVGGEEEFEIESMVHFNEDTGSEESLFMYHKESNFYFRPWTRDGVIPNTLEITFTAYADGAQVPTDTYLNAPLSGDVAFAKEIKGNRISLKLSMSQSEYIIVGMSSIYGVQDRTDIVAANSGEMTRQRVLADGMNIWITRPNVLINRAASNDQRGAQLGRAVLSNNLKIAGTNLGFGIGSSYTLVTGPDGIAYSAIRINGFLNSGISVVKIGSTLVVG